MTDSGERLAGGCMERRAGSSTLRRLLILHARAGKGRILRAKTDNGIERRE